MAFTAPADQAYERDDDNDVVVHSGGPLAAQDSNAHYAVHIQDLEDGRGRGYNRSISFADHPPGTLVSGSCCHLKLISPATLLSALKRWGQVLFCQCPC